MQCMNILTKMLNAQIVLKKAIDNHFMILNVKNLI